MTFKPQEKLETYFSLKAIYLSTRKSIEITFTKNAHLTQHFDTAAYTKTNQWLIYAIFKEFDALTALQPRVTVTSCFIYKVAMEF